MEKTYFSISGAKECNIGVCIASSLTVTIIASAMILGFSGPNTAGICVSLVVGSWILAMWWLELATMIYFIPARLRNRNHKKMLHKNDIKMQLYHKSLIELDKVNEFVTYCRGNK